MGAGRRLIRQRLCERRIWFAERAICFPCTVQGMGRAIAMGRCVPIGLRDGRPCLRRGRKAAVLEKLFAVGKIPVSLIRKDPLPRRPAAGLPHGDAVFMYALATRQQAPLLLCVDVYDVRRDRDVCIGILAAWLRPLGGLPRRRQAKRERYTPVVAAGGCPRLAACARHRPTTALRPPNPTVPPPPRTLFRVHRLTQPATLHAFQSTLATHGPTLERGQHLGVHRDSTNHGNEEYLTSQK
jgi:hypothetical protein